ncbi:MAG: tetratricopeptide repeat protein [Caulobacter sp.]
MKTGPFAAAAILALTLSYAVPIFAAEPPPTASADPSDFSPRQDESARVARVIDQANRGYLYSQFLLATFYEDGNGVPQSDAKAAYWYRRSAEKGFSVSQYKLGEILEYGRGVTIDFSQSEYWYRKAAAQEFQPAQLKLQALNRQTIRQGRYVFRKLSDGRRIYADEAYSDAELDSMYGAAPPPPASTSSNFGSAPLGGGAGPTPGLDPPPLERSGLSPEAADKAIMSGVASLLITAIAVVFGLLFFAGRRAAGAPVPSKPWIYAIIWGGIPLFTMAAPPLVFAVLNGQPLGPAAFKAMGPLLWSPILGCGAYLVVALRERRRQPEPSTEAGAMPAPTPPPFKQEDSDAPDPFTVAGEEILSGKLEPAAWARSLLEANGDELKAKGRYVELRVAQLKG